MIKSAIKPEPEIETDSTKRREHLLGKLREVFRDGYRPARGKEPYTALLKNGFWAYQQVNCLGHIFNLRNQQFDDYAFKPYTLYGDFPRSPWASNHAYAEQMLDFVREAGLRVRECDPAQPMTDFRSWKIALYYAPDDFHYLLEDAPHQWSSKCGPVNAIEHLNRAQPPRKYRYCNLPDPKLSTYHLYNTYEITNPHADANNRYVKDRTR